jgi:hypothetical protein
MDLDLEQMFDVFESADNIEIADKPKTKKTNKFFDPTKQVQSTYFVAESHFLLLMLYSALCL